MKYKKEDIIILDDDSLKKYQAELLKIAKDVVGVFEKHNIDYSLSGGSILGAVRHQGFIPWDDDIDFNITRKGYEKLLKLFNDELGHKYYIQTPQEYPEIGLMVSQIRKKNTIARRQYDWDREQCGISIDLYIVENVFDNVVARHIQKNMSMVCSFAISSIRFVKNQSLPPELFQLEARQIKYYKLKKITGKMFNVIPLKTWIKWCDYWNSLCKNDKTKYVAIPTGRKHFSGEIYERKNMCVYKKIKFEDYEFNTPIWDTGYLARFYGDYMTIPPIEKREKHLFLELKY